MVDRIGAFRDIVPVTSRANDPPAPPVPVPKPEAPGVKWSKVSTFKYKLPLFDTVYDPNAPDGAGSTVKDAPKEVYETRVESLANAVMWKTQDYDEIHTVIETGGTTTTMVTAETWTEAWVLLGTETIKEINGFTMSADGSITERFKSVEIERYLHITFKKRATTPQKRNVTHKYGELPPQNG